ncbi:hypothetical protein [Pseudomonas nunensis]|uniref:hypothetical protein n=1 Tax=Pseudomonas nunensis TaxID=2961896 RepID=UPI0025B0AD57|nr:hypothetical protein [Pseudomonas nunensis]MDN3218900.1 hypothetical protein [Pseudomonas nunensis]
MRLIVIGSAVLAFATLAGCAGWFGPQGPVVVDYYAGMTDLSGYPKMKVGEVDSLFDTSGVTKKHPFRPFNVRQCNTQRTECSLGIVGLTSHVQILSVGESSAKLKVSFDYKVGDEWRNTVAGGAFVEKLPDLEVILDQGEVSRTAEIPYGEVRHVELPYGLIFTLCASPPGVSNMDARPCASQLEVKDYSGAPAF